MPVEEHLMASCDAPDCQRVLTSGDGTVLFHSRERLLEVAEESDWLVKPDHREVERFYCPSHWHRQFGVRSPYWGAKRRRRFV